MATLPTDSFPDVSNVQVQIITEPESLATEEVESLVTIPIESVLNGLPKITKVRSNSSFGLSVVTAIFEDDTDVYFARQLVQQRLNGLELPQDIPTPMLGPVVSSFSQVYMYYLQSKERDLIDLRTLQDWVVAKRLLTVPGVGNVISYGGFVKQYQVLVSPDKLKGFGLALSDVIQAISKNNMNAGGNFIEQSGEEIIIRGLGRISTEEDIGDIVLKEQAGTPVKVSQVADIVIGPAFRRGSGSMDGKGETVTGVVLTRKGANTKEVITRVEEKIEQIRKLLPDDVTVIPYYNQVELVDRTTDTVREILGLSGVLVVVILAAILLDIRSALIAAAIIPLSLLFSFIMMKLTGLSANLMTLGAVDFGVVVDAGVVMVENIFRKLSDLHETKKAGDEKIDTLPIITAAAQEVGKPITFAIFIIIAVYLPLFTLQGVEGKMFHPLALTFIYAIMGALFTALLIIPALCFWVLRKPGPEKHNPFLHWMRLHYGNALNTTLKIPKTVFFFAILGLLASTMLLPFLGSEFIPSLDEGSILLRTKLPPSVSHTESRRVGGIVERLICKFPEVSSAVTHIGRSGMGSDLEGVDNADVLISLKPKKDWVTTKDKEELVNQMAAEVSKIPGLIKSFSQPIEDMVDDLVAGIKCDVAVKVFGDDPVTVDKIAGEILAAIRDIPGASDLSKEQILGLPQLNIALKRDVIARYGLNVSDIQEVIQTALAGRVVSEVIEGSRRFGILIRFPKENRDTEEDIKTMLVATPAGARIPLHQLADITNKRGLVMINREDQNRRTAVLINVRGRDMGSFVQDAQAAVAKKIKLPKGYWIVWGGQFENQQRAMARLCIVVPVVLALIFLLLFATFDSFKHAGIVMLNVPFAVIGGIVGLWLTHQPLSVPAIIGFIALFGVAVQNGVILVSCIMQIEKDGASVEEAIKQGAALRLRPVFMTALVAVMGLLPKLMSDGTGAEIQRPLATVVFGGLLSATTLTLLVLPAVYKLLIKPKVATTGEIHD